MRGLVYGLQTRLRRFESARHLLLKDDEQILFIIFFLALIRCRLAPYLLCFPISIKNGDSRKEVGEIKKSSIFVL